ncbi:MAG TPA: HAD-IIB family hydrolase [Acidimicrobiales bacterium]|nr:HAD-IIB family hydrolase [Acidimicrobiales bacterium]
MKKLFVFDLDGTLAPSKSPLTEEMAGLLTQLLGVMKVAVISGGSWQQFESQLLGSIPSTDHFENLYLLPTCGTQFFHYERAWIKDYAEDLSASERTTVIASLERALVESGVRVERVWGEAIEDRGSQITLSVLGQRAPLDVKATWDPDFAKRRRIVAILVRLLPDFAINMGGTTSIDVTKPGVDKAYGITKLHEHLDIAVSEMLFAGDAVFEGGNDFPVQSAGVDSILVRDPSETARVIQTVIACLGDGSQQVRSPGRAR